MDPFMDEAHPLRYDSGIRTEMKDHDSRHQSRSQIFTASVEELILIRATNRNRTPPVLLVPSQRRPDEGHASGLD